MKLIPKIVAPLVITGALAAGAPALADSISVANNPVTHSIVLTSGSMSIDALPQAPILDVPVPRHRRTTGSRRPRPSPSASSWWGFRSVRPGDRDQPGPDGLRDADGAAAGQLGRHRDEVHQHRAEQLRLRVALTDQPLPAKARSASADRAFCCFAQQDFRT